MTDDRPKNWRAKLYYRINLDIAAALDAGADMTEYEIVSSHAALHGFWDPERWPGVDPDFVLKYFCGLPVRYDDTTTSVELRKIA